MKFTKKAFRAALKANDKTKVWQLVAMSLKRTPTKTEVYNYVVKFSSTLRDFRKAYKMAYGIREKKTSPKMVYPKYTISLERGASLAMLRRMLTEKPSNYTKVPMMGHTHLYFCSPSYGHADYNKVRTCNIEGNEEFVNKIVKIGEKFMQKHNI